MTRRLHIGGTVAREGWEVLNAIPAEWVDHVGRAEDLSRFADRTFAEVYASHVLEHLSYQSALPAALAEWHRVLAPDGRLMVSVPDLDTLCELYTSRDVLGPEQRFAVMRMMFGGQVDPFDFHCVGLNEELLTSYLSGAGFSAIRRVHDFGVFQDCSTLVFAGRPISLNLEAHKHSSGKEGSIVEQKGTATEAPQPQRGEPAELRIGGSSSWSGGYYTGLTYGCTSFRELAPNWIDFALLSQRQRPPRVGGEGRPFHYLELGSGMGLGLCLLAAAYPEGQFIGIDFHPSHIAHSQWLVAELGLTNVSFHEADFLELAADDAQHPFAADLRFHYVVAHGILSWIAPEVREALLQLSGRLLRSGGAFYCSYNTFPGWLDRTSFKALADLERQRLGAANVMQAMERASSSLGMLLQNGSVLGRAFPLLANQIGTIRAINRPDYLCGEYGAEHWQPFYVGEVHQLAAGHKLIYAASASLPDNFPSLLPSPVAELLVAEGDPTIRQALQDLAINQSFRRDLFVKGPLPLTRVAQEQSLSELRLRGTGNAASLSHTADSCAPERIETNLGGIVDDSGRLQELEAMLAAQPSTLAELHQALAIPPEELVVLTSLLLHADRIGLDRGTAATAAISACRDVNSRLMALMQGGHNLGYLAAPAVGHGAQRFNLIDALILEGLRQGLDGEILSGCVLLGLQATGAELRGPDGDSLNVNDVADCTQHIGRFRSATLPVLLQLGMIDSLN